MSTWCTTIWKKKTHEGAAAVVLAAMSLGGIALWTAMPMLGGSTAAAVDGSGKSWDRQMAARYLDDRETWWQQWPHAQKDNGTICISCHTVVPYAMARGGLRRELGESGLSAPEKTMLASVEKRVSGWPRMATFYSDEKTGPGKTEESRATEAVLNAVILASYDARLGQVRAITRTAFENAWALQLQSGEDVGGWKWQQFHLGPWEEKYSGYQGAALLMVMAENEPDGFAAEPAVRAHLERVREYLRREYAAQPLLNQLYVLWAAEKDASLMSGEERKALLDAVAKAQSADGGWRTAGLVQAERMDGTAEPAESDGYATGLAVLAMEKSGISHDDINLQRGMAWLETHQLPDGAWSALSLNRKRDQNSDAYLFMTDAATGYAVMALEK